MAEAWTKLLKGDQFEAYSAGVSPKGIDPRAIKAMAEVSVPQHERVCLAIRIA
jgi:arsenate reductase (thioredoxin)